MPRRQPRRHRTERGRGRTGSRQRLSTGRPGRLVASGGARAIYLRVRAERTRRGAARSRRVVSRRQVLGGGLAGAAGLVVAGVGIVAGVRRGRDAAAMPPRSVDALGRVTGAPGRSPSTGWWRPSGSALDDVYFGWQLGDDRRGARPDAPTAWWCTRPALTGSAPARAAVAAVVWDSGRVASARAGVRRLPGPRARSRHRLPLDRPVVAGDGRPEPLRAPRHLRDRARRPRLEGQVDRPRLPARARARRVHLRPTGVHAGELAHRAGPRLCVGRPAVRAVPERHPGREGPGVLLPRLAVLRDPRRHVAAAGRCAQRRGASSRAGRGRPRAIPPGSPGSSCRSRCCTATVERELIVTDGVVAGPRRGRGWRERSATSRVTSSTSPRTSTGPSSPVGWEEPGFDDSTWARGHGARARRRLARGGIWCRCAPASWRSPSRRVSLTRLASGAVVADFGKVYAAVPTVSFHHGTVGRLVTMRAGLPARRARGRASPSPACRARCRPPTAPSTPT